MNEWRTPKALKTAAVLGLAATLLVHEEPLFHFKPDIPPPAVQAVEWDWPYYHTHEEGPPLPNERQACPCPSGDYTAALSYPPILQ